MRQLPNKSYRVAQENRRTGFRIDDSNRTIESREYAIVDQDLVMRFAYVGSAPDSKVMLQDLRRLVK